MALTQTKKEKPVKKPTTLQEYKDQGWTVGPNILMSNPPVYFLSKDGKTIRFRPKMKISPGMPKPKRPGPDPKPKRKMPKGLKGLGKSVGKSLGKRAAEKIKELSDRKRDMMGGSTPKKPKGLRGGGVARHPAQTGPTGIPGGIGGGIKKAIKNLFGKKPKRDPRILGPRQSMPKRTRAFGPAGKPRGVGIAKKGYGKA